MSITRRVVALVSAGILLACSDKPTDRHILAPDLRLSEIPDNAAGPSASGHANVIQLPSGALRTFSFTARVMPDGTVSGEYDNHNRQGAAVNHGDIDCLRFIGTNVAVMSGPVKRHTNPLVLEGARSIFTVQDNGEGADPPDKVSLLFVFAAGATEDCQNFTPPANLDAIDGNIRVDAVGTP